MLLFILKERKPFLRKYAKNILWLKVCQTNTGTILAGDYRQSQDRQDNL